MVAAVQESIGVAEAAGARLQISHLKAMGPENWGAVDRALELIDAARARGVDVTADVYPYTASSTDLSSRLAGGRSTADARRSWFGSPIPCSAPGSPTSCVPDSGATSIRTVW